MPYPCCRLVVSRNLRSPAHPFRTFDCDASAIAPWTPPQPLPYGEGACARGLIVTVSPQRDVWLPQSLTIRACDWALSSSSVPNGLFEGAALDIFARFLHFVPQMGDKSPELRIRLRLTHPPVVFGPHRSPRDGGHIFSRRGAGCVVTDMPPRIRARSPCNIWVTFWSPLFRRGLSPLAWATPVRYLRRRRFSRTGST